MSWKENNGRDRGHRDGVGEFLRGPGSLTSPGGTPGKTVSIKGNKTVVFDQDFEGRMVVVGPTGNLPGNLALESTLLETYVRLGPSGAINTTLESILNGLTGIGGQLSITGPVGITGPVQIIGSGNTAFKQDLTTGNMIVQGNVGITGPVGITGLVGITGPVSITGPVKIFGSSTMPFNQDATTGNMIIQGTGTAGAVPISGSVSVSSVIVSSITNTVTVQGTGVTGTALALDSSIALLNWYLQPARKALPSNGDTWEQPPGGGITGPYYNTLFISGYISSAVVDIFGVNPFFQYSNTLGFIRADDNQTPLTATTYRVPYTAIIEGQNSIVGGNVRFISDIYYTMEITIPARYVTYTPTNVVITSNTTLLKK